MNRIRESRAAANLTMKQLGAMVGVSESTVSLYETGKRQPDNETLVRIADVLDVSIDYLLGRAAAKELPAVTDGELDIDELDKKILALIHRLPADLKESLLGLLEGYVKAR